MAGQSIRPGERAPGCSAPTLLGVYGKDGTYFSLLQKHLTSRAKCIFFGGERKQWYELAQNRAPWKRFVASVTA